MDKFAGYAVLSDYLRGVSTELGIQRIPRVVRLGVNFHRFYAPVSTELKIVGYGGSMFRDDNGGVDLKRGSLVKQATENAGLAFNPSGKFHFLAMPEYYRHVDAVIVSSSREGYGLPAMEAAAAGRLVISTSVGAFTDQASLGAGILAPNDPEGFVEFVTEKLIEFKFNANSYFETCVAIQSAARRLDWQFVTDEWIDLLTFPQSARGR
jgi:glycosyltransferase involved in cell wall biosynthesis